MVISASDYMKKVVTTKVITLEEGIDFRIRQLSTLKFLEMQKPPSETNLSDQIKMILLNGVVEPALSDKPEECLPIKEDGKILIDNISTDNLTKLVAEIMKFSGYYNEDGSVKSFFSDAKKPSGSTE